VTLVSAAAPDPASPQIDLQFEAVGGRTRLQRRRVRYPYAITVPLCLDRDPIDLRTVFLQSASGGVFEGERLKQRFVSGAGARVCVTTPAAAVVHGMPGEDHAECRIALSAGAGSYLEYRPLPLVLFPGARFRQSLTLELADGATAVLGDGFLGHDPAAGGRSFDWIDSGTEIRRADGRLIAADRFVLRGREAFDGLPGISRGIAAHGWMIALAPAGCISVPDLCADIADGCDAVAGLYAGASSLPRDEGIFVRLAAADSLALQEGLQVALSRVRQAVNDVSRRRKLPTPPDRHGDGA
jgi:urease accessory protein